MRDGALSRTSLGRRWFDRERYGPVDAGSGMKSRARFNADPVEYRLDAPRRLLIIWWRDGHESHLPFDELRRVCPCADCRSVQKPQGGLQVLTGPVVRPGEIRIAQISAVGRYALSFTWSDGHSTGIYSFDFLRHLCPCEACRSGTG